MVERSCNSALPLRETEYARRKLMIVFEKLIVWKESCIYPRGDDRYFQRRATKGGNIVCLLDSMSIRELNNDRNEKFLN